MLVPDDKFTLWLILQKTLLLISLRVLCLILQKDTTIWKKSQKFYATQFCSCYSVKEFDHMSRLWSPNSNLSLKLASWPQLQIVL